MALGLRLRRFLERFYEPIAIILNLCLVLSGIWLHASLWNWPVLVISASLMVVLGILDLLLKRINDRYKARGTYEKYINLLLKAAAVSMLKAANPPSGHIRANIMLLDDDRLLPEGEQRRLSIRYSYGFDFGDQDVEILIPIGTGCAGQACQNHKAMVADVTELLPPGGLVQWGLPPSEIEKVRPTLKSIFSIPVHYGSSYRQHIAILNFDSDNTIAEMKFNDTNIQTIAFCFAQTFQGLLTEMY
jgi:hypothetical protein